MSSVSCVKIIGISQMIRGPSGTQLIRNEPILCKHTNNTKSITLKYHTHYLLCRCTLKMVRSILFKNEISGMLGNELARSKVLTSCTVQKGSLSTIQVGSETLACKFSENLTCSRISIIIIPVSKMAENTKLDGAGKCLVKHQVYSGSSEKLLPYYSCRWKMHSGSISTRSHKKQEPFMASKEE